jgi:hypothetical protein
MSLIGWVPPVRAWFVLHENHEGRKGRAPFAEPSRPGTYRMQFARPLLLFTNLLVRMPYVEDAFGDQAINLT